MANLTTSTDIDAFLASATNAAARAALGAVAISPATQFSHFDDFITGWADFVENSFGGSSGVLDAQQGRPGVVYIRDGTSGGNVVRRWLASSSSSEWISFMFGGGEFTFETSINLTASNSLDKVRFGFQDEEIYSSVTDGIYFEINGSNQLVLVTVNNGSATTSSTLATLTVGTWYRVGFIVNSGGTSVQAYINGSSTGSPNTTNIPTSRTTGFSYAIRKSGANSYSEMAIDYYSISQVVSR